ncbi:MAG TPA: L,D-transpeptidase [Devosia sp.]|nr:L,D-transpeptidase [Devosia sp.]
MFKPLGAALLLGLVAAGLWYAPASAGQNRVSFPPPAGMSLTTSTPQNGLALLSNQTASPQYLRQIVAFRSNERPGTVIVNTSEKFLYLVLPGNRALRYGVGVAREGFEWTGTNRVSAKREWPGWTPPAEMRLREPDLPAFMPGGPDNPLGARALYLGSTLYRIHGTSQAWTIGQNISSGCIRLTNQDVKDLYNRVAVGAKVIVL